MGEIDIVSILPWDTVKSDGYGSRFFKSYWDTVKSDVIAAIREFFSRVSFTGHLTKQLLL